MKIFLPIFTLILSSLLLNAQTLPTADQYPPTFIDYINENLDDPLIQDFLQKQKGTKKNTAFQRSAITVPDSTYSYRWNTATMEWELRTRATVLDRDDDNNPTTELIENANGGSNYEPTYKSDFTFHGADILASKVSYRWDTDANQWSVPVRIWEYDPSGKFVYFENIQFNTSNEQTFGYKETFTYNDNDFYIGGVYHYWNELTGEWGLAGKIKEEPDLNGERVYTVRHLWEDALPSGYFVPRDSVVYIRSSDDVLTEIVYHDWNEDLNFWELSTKHLLQYNSDDQHIETLILDWDVATNDWINSIKTEYTYNVGGHRITYFYEKWDEVGQVWEGNIDNTRSYDSMDNLIGEIEFRWDNLDEVWFGTNNYRYKYENDNRTESFIKRWNHVDWDWENRDSILYYYSPEPPDPDSIDVEEPSLELMVSPNPSNGIFSINYDYTQEASTDCQVLNASGELVQLPIVSEGVLSIDLSDQPKGLYFLVLPTGETTKLLRQ